MRCIGAGTDFDLLFPLAYIPEFALIGMSLILRRGGFAGAAGSTSLEADGC
jgi:hypothetical protein